MYIYERSGIMITSVSKWGNSQGVRINKNLLELLNLKINDPVDVIVEDNKIIIMKTEEKPKVTMKSLFENFDGEYETVEIEWGERVGKEEW